jgi:hypothetical protein
MNIPISVNSPSSFMSLPKTKHALFAQLLNRSDRFRARSRRAPLPRVCGRQSRRFAKIQSWMNADDECSASPSHSHRRFDLCIMNLISLLRCLASV